MIRFFVQALLLLSLISCASKKFILYAPDFPPSPVKINRPDVAIVLSAGGTKGAAHLGVLEVLEENHIPVGLIVGSSAGAIVGAFYADNPSVEHIKNILINLNKNDLIENIAFSYFGIPILYSGPIEGNKFREFMHLNLNANDFSDLKIPLIVVTTDMVSGRIYLIRSGPLAPALHATSAVPLIFQPVSLYGRTLSDGAVISPVPVRTAKIYKPKITIAVNITAKPESTPMLSNWDVFRRGFDISYYELAKEETSLADVIITPNIFDIGMFDDESNLRSYEEGRLAAKVALPKILALMKKHGISKKINANKALI